jgi:fermentation-respiration switch protein FrsA (DUF1100 family)
MTPFACWFGKWHRLGTMKRRTLWGLTFLALLVVGIFWGIMLRWFEHNQVYHPSRAFMATGAELRRPFENVFFETSDGVKLNGWFFPAGTNSHQSPVTFLVCHGNGGNISHRLELYRILLETGINVFVFDYRGYGLSQGRPSEEGTYQDSQAALRWLQKRGLSRVIVYGESLGGGVASELCLREHTLGLVLQSTFTSIPDIGAELFPWLPVRRLSKIKYDTLAKLPRITVPILVMHSRNDGLIPFRHGERLFAAAHEPKLFWEIEGDHNRPLSDAARFRAGIEKFLGVVEAGTRPSAKGEIIEQPSATKMDCG